MNTGRPSRDRSGAQEGRVQISRWRNHRKGRRETVALFRQLAPRADVVICDAEQRMVVEGEAGRRETESGSFGSRDVRGAENQRRGVTGRVVSWRAWPPVWITVPAMSPPAAVTVRVPRNSLLSACGNSCSRKAATRPLA